MKIGLVWWLGGVAGLVAFLRHLAELVVHFKEWTTSSENNAPLKIRKKKAR